MRRLLITPQFEKDLKKIPKDTRGQADWAVQRLVVNPLYKTLAIRKLTAIRPPVWRLRLGVYRLIYIFNRDSLTLLRLHHRRDVYRGL